MKYIHICLCLSNMEVSYLYKLSFLLISYFGIKLSMQKIPFSLSPVLSSSHKLGACLHQLTDNKTKEELAKKYKG